MNNGEGEVMDLRDIDLNLLVVFNQLLLDRSVSTAGEKLGLTQPAVSNSLKRLRTALAAVERPPESPDTVSHLHYRVGIRLWSDIIRT
jgi:hypothetical protein